MPGGQRTAENDLLAINDAIRKVWPTVKQEVHAASVFTFASGTLTYSLSALTDLTDRGVARLLVYPDSNDAPVEVPAWVGKYNYVDDTWSVTVPATVAAAYGGKSVDVLYWARHPVLSTLADTTQLPDDLLQAGMKAWYAELMLTQGNVQNSNWRDLLPLYRQEFESLKKRHANYSMTGSGRMAVMP